MSVHVVTAYPEVLAAGLTLPAASDFPVADFSDTPWWLSLVKAVLVFVYLMLSVVVVIWAERRVIGQMQQRPGPNRFGPLGILQTLGDGVKLFLKEDVTPKPHRVLKKRAAGLSDGEKESCHCHSLGSL